MLLPTCSSCCDCFSPLIVTAMAMRCGGNRNLEPGACYIVVLAGLQLPSCHFAECVLCPSASAPQMDVVISCMPLEDPQPYTWHLGLSATVMRRIWRLHEDEVCAAFSRVRDALGGLTPTRGQPDDAARTLADFLLHSVPSSR